MSTDQDAPRYTARRSGPGAFAWGPYDTKRGRWIISTRYTETEAQKRADQLNAAGVDWTYADDEPKYPTPPTPAEKIREALTMAERAVDAAGRSVDAAEHYLINSGFVALSPEYEAAVKFYDAARALLQTTKDAAGQLVAAQPTATTDDQEVTDTRSGRTTDAGGPVPSPSQHPCDVCGWYDCEHNGRSGRAAAP